MDCCRAARRRRKRLRVQPCSCAQTSPARSPGNRSTWMVASLFTESFSKLMLAGSVHFVLVNGGAFHHERILERLVALSITGFSNITEKHSTKGAPNPAPKTIAKLFLAPTLIP